MKAFVVGAAVAALASVLLVSTTLTSAAILRDDAVEYARNDKQLAFWSKRSPITGTPVLLTFPADVTVAEALPRLTAAFVGGSVADAGAARGAGAAIGGQCAFVQSSQGTVLGGTPSGDAEDATEAANTRVATIVERALLQPPKQVLETGAVSLFCTNAPHLGSEQLSAAASSEGATSRAGNGWFRLPLVGYQPPSPPPPNRPKWIGSSQWPNTNADLVGDTLTGLLHWGVEFLAVHWGKVHPFQTWTTAGASGRFNLNTGAPISVTTPGASAFADGAARATSDDETRLALTADWGSGTQESAAVANLLVKDYAPHWTIHIGDVYYLGASEDFKSNVFGIPPAGVANAVTWPHGSLGSWALCGNHEMYSRGFAFYDEFLPSLGVRNDTGALGGQGASYFSLENDYWRVISLDTGYNTYSVLFESNDNPQPQPVIDWLQNDVRIGDPTDTRGIVFLSHHQTLSAFGGEDPYLATPKQINALLPANRTVLWLWGHEHRVSFYDFNTDLDSLENLHLYGRCIGNGGFPTSHAPIPGRAAATKLMAYDDRVYETYDGFWTANIGFQGFQHLNFSGPALTIDYKSLALEADGKTPSQTASDLLVTETWGVAPDGSVTLDAFSVVNPNMTLVNPL